MYYILKRRLHSIQSDLVEVVWQFRNLQREADNHLAYTEGNDRITFSPGLAGPLWSKVGGFISHYTLS